MNFSNGVLDLNRTRNRVRKYCQKYHIEYDYIRMHEFSRDIRRKIKDPRDKTWKLQQTPRGPFFVGLHLQTNSSSSLHSDVDGRARVEYDLKEKAEVLAESLECLLTENPPSNSACSE